MDRRVEGVRVCQGGGGELSQESSERRNIIIAVCPNLTCGKELNDHNVTIGNPPVPVIRLGWRYFMPELRNGDHALHVSAIWDDHTLVSDVPIEKGRVLDLFCPFCKEQFPSRTYCECNARMVEIRTRRGPTDWGDSILVCARRGCPGHKKVPLGAHMGSAGLQFMCGAGRTVDAAVMRAAGATRGTGRR
jgi:hypothetical protein